MYKISLDILLIAAGIISKADVSKLEAGKSQFESQIAFYTDKLSREEEEQVLSFIKFLKSQNKNTTSGS